MAKTKKLNPKTSTLVSEEKARPIVYDPQKSYSWGYDLKLEMSGKEFEVLIRALQANLQPNQFQAHVMQYEALGVAQNILKRYVENGQIKEVETPQE